MSLSPGTRLGSYEILAAIGSGGMGEVYRAHDPKLKRDVALKVLPELFSRDPDRLARFEREARTLAALNHPNIAQIYGVVEDPAATALVMEFVDGQDLAARLERGPLPLDESLGIARQMALALEAAHEHGIVHRDLKPANVKVRPDGVVKLLDFGLAKALGSPDAPDSVAMANSPTLTSPAMTSMGVIIGTAAYMSPEQARGGKADRRSDVWAFGVLLFEMLTGRRAFKGTTTSDALASVLRDAPALESLPPDTPPSVRRLLRRCLDKDRGCRLDSMAVARMEIEEALRPEALHVEAHIPPRRGDSRMVAIAVLALVLVGTGLALGRWWGGALPSGVSSMRFDIATPPTTDPSSFALSPDGLLVVYAGDDPQGASMLWVRSLATGETHPLPESDRGLSPFWAPNSRSIGYFIDRRLYRQDVDGGSPQSLAPADLAVAGAWGPDGTIVFASLGNPLRQVPSRGGPPAPIPGLAPLYAGHFSPSFLPDGRHFLYFVRGDTSVSGIYIGSLDKEPSTRLLTAPRGAAYGAGALFFTRDATLFSVPFDLNTHALGASPRELATGLTKNQNLAVSRAGSVAFRTGEPAVALTGDFDLAAYDRSGTRTPIGIGGQSPNLSPDERTLVMHRELDGNIDVWMFDLVRRVANRVTSNPADDVLAVWSPDARQIVFSSNRRGTHDLYIKQLASGENRPLVVNDQMKIATDWSRDGRWILFVSSDPRTGRDIWAVAADGHAPAIPVVRTPFDEQDGQFSPDSRWIAYESNETGRPEVWVRPFPGPGSAVPVSTAGGSQPRWRDDGRELFYVDLRGRLMSVPVSVHPADGALEPSTPTALFLLENYDFVPERQQYVVADHGQRFIGVGGIESAAAKQVPPLTILLNGPIHP